MIQLKSLEIQGFRSFKDQATFVFPTSGAALITGRYKDSSISSGSGKSSGPMAIAYALGYCDLPATELKNRDSKTMSVRLVITDGQQDYEITRSPKLKLRCGEELSEGAVAEDRLSKLLGASSDVCKLLTYRPQRERGHFLSKTDAQQKDFLSTLLGLNAIEGAHDAANNRLTVAQNNVKNAQYRIDVLTTQLASMSFDENAYRAAENEYAGATAKLNTLSDAAVKDQKQRGMIIDGELSKLRTLSMQVENARRENLSIRQNATSLKAELDQLKNNTCPTCRREWGNTAALIDQKQTNIRSLISKMESNAALIKSSEPILATEQALSAERDALLAVVNQHSAQANDVHRRIDSARRLITELLNKKNAITDLSGKLQQETANLASAQQQMPSIEHACAILSRTGFLSRIFDEILVEIEMRANEMIALIPNISSYTLRISSISLTKSGTAKKSISISLMKDGKDISVKSLSGGQSCALELCTDLAVSETIRSRSGTKLGWLVLDEAMDGLDIETKRHALDMLKAKVGGLMIIIDHATEVKEGFGTVFDIEFDGRTSRVL